MSLSFGSITRELIAALDEEVRAIKSSGGSDRVGLRAGEYCGAATGHFIYKFLLDSELFVPTDTPGKLQLGESSYDVAVLAITEFEITLSVSKHIVEPLSRATLSFSAYYLLERLRERLGDMMKKPFDGQLMPMRLVGQLSNESLSGGTAHNTPDEHLNTEQLDAVNCCLKQAVTFVWGPPGTGKTYLVSKLIQELVRRDERVLVTSHTNVAVDTALLRGIEGLGPCPAGTIVRVGDLARNEPGLLEASLDKVVEQKSESLRLRKADLEHRLRAVSADQERLAAALRLLEQSQQADRLVEKARTSFLQIERKTDEVRRTREAARQSLEVLLGHLRDAEKSSPLKRMIPRFNPNRIQQMVSRKELDIQNAEAMVEDAERSRSANAYELSEAESEAARLRRELAKGDITQPHAEIRTQLAEAEKAITTLTDETSRTDARLREISATAIAEARVVGATLSRFVINDELLRGAFDTIIVDEVSMVLMPYLWFVASKARTRFVALGDPMQLPPISIAQDAAEYPMAAKWLGRDPFILCGLGAGPDTPAGSRLCRLSMQYRMHPDIGEVANRLTYRAHGNPLQHAAEFEKYRAGLEAHPCPGAALVLCDTSRANPWCAIRHPTMSRYNIYSAVVCVRLAKQALAAGTRSVGIIAPYRAQARLVQTLIEQEGLHRENVFASTVHRYQGNEKDAIVLDVVEGPPLHVGRPLRGDSGDDAARLLNVACTRAKGKLIVVAHVKHVMGKVDTAQSLRALVEHLMREAKVMDAGQLLQGHGDADIGQAIWVTGGMQRTLGDLGGAMYYDEGTFYSAFLKDLMAASNQVLLYSPFVAEERLAGMMTPIRHLIDRGVSVTVVTRASSPSNVVARKLEAQMRDAGVDVVPKSRLHEKLVFIDENVAWFGSLNILSQRTSTELMLRMAEPGFARRLMECTGAISILQKQEQQRKTQTRLVALEQALKARVEFPICNLCGETTVLKTGKYGPFFGCPNYASGRCSFTSKVSRNVLSAAVSDLDLKCGKCEGPLELKFGRRGPFVKCSRCPCTESL